MLSEIVKQTLMLKSQNDFVKSLEDMTENRKGEFLYKIWNAYCECRCNDEDQLFDFEDKDDEILWHQCCGEITFSEKRYGMRIADYGSRSITLKYLSVDELSEMCIAAFSDIYQYVLKEPFCFDSPLACMVLHPVLKEIGILNPHVVGFDSEIINDELLK